VIFLAILALLRPSWKERQLEGERFIFLIDNSASMQATDVGQSRLEDAKQKVLKLIDEMRSGEAAMVISFADSPRVKQNFTDNRPLLREAVRAIEPTSRPTSLREALKVASGLANPGHVGEDFRPTPDMLVHLYIFSDGKCAPVSGFSLGNLKFRDPEKPEEGGGAFVPIGRPDASNVGIMAFNVRRSEADPELYQAFARLENFGTEAVDVELGLYRYRRGGTGEDQLIDFRELTLPAGKAGGAEFDLEAGESGVLELRLSSATDDHLAVDDRAWTVVSPPRPVRVLLVTPGNEPLELALTTDSLEEIAEVVRESPKFLEGKQYAEKAVSGGYDLVIYDRCAPKEMPRANTLFIGSLPPQKGWSAKPKVDVPWLMPVSTPHPLMQWIELGNVRLLEGTPLEVPSGGSVLIDSDLGPMLAIAPREGFEDAVLGFVLLGEEEGPDGKTERYIGTDWMTKESFPVFVLNVFDYLGGARNLLGSGNVQPGRPVVLEGPAPGAKLRVYPPAGRAADLKAGKLGKVNFTDTGELGPYEVRCQGKTLRWFAVNLFHPPESNIRPDPKPVIKIGYVEVEGQTGWKTASGRFAPGMVYLQSPGVSVSVRSAARGPVETDVFHDP
jgi:hypothetical protein